MLNGGEVVEMSNPVRGSHRKLVIRDGRIVAGALVGDLNRIGLITQHYDRQTVLGPREPGDLLLADISARSAPLNQLPEDAEICNCAGVTVGAIRACSSFEDARRDHARDHRLRWLRDGRQPDTGRPSNLHTEG